MAVDDELCMITANNLFKFEIALLIAEMPFFHIAIFFVSIDFFLTNSLRNLIQGHNSWNCLPCLSPIFCHSFCWLLAIYIGTLTPLEGELERSDIAGRRAKQEERTPTLVTFNFLYDIRQTVKILETSEQRMLAHGLGSKLPIQRQIVEHCSFLSFYKWNTSRWKARQVIGRLGEGEEEIRHWGNHF